MTTDRKPPAAVRPPAVKTSASKNGKNAPAAGRPPFTRRLAGEGRSTTANIRHPDTTYPVPAEELFDDDKAYLGAPDLQQIAQALMKDEHGSGIGHFAHLKGVRVVYLWKRTGGAPGGRPTLGKCSKPSGLLQHFAEADFVIWLATDHLRDMRLSTAPMAIPGGATYWQVEALVFHQLEHIGIEETDDGDEKLILKPHDLEIFRSEVERYGPWQADIAVAAASFEQMPLWEQGVVDG